MGCLKHERAIRKVNKAAMNSATNVSGKPTKNPKKKPFKMMSSTGPGKHSVIVVVKRLLMTTA
eukprot:5281981-Amphidinium_carterae.1